MADKLRDLGARRAARDPRAALSYLRDRTASPPNADIVNVLIRAALLCPEAAGLLVNCPLHTRAQLQLAVCPAASETPPDE